MKEIKKVIPCLFIVAFLLSLWSASALAVLKKIPVGASGAPVANTEVTILNEDGKEVGKGRTDEKGVLLYNFPDEGGKFIIVSDKGKQEIAVPAASKLAGKQIIASVLSTMSDEKHLDNGYGIGTEMRFPLDLGKLDKFDNPYWHAGLAYTDYSNATAYSANAGIGFTKPFGKKNWALDYGASAGYKHRGSYSYKKTKYCPKKTSVSAEGKPGVGFYLGAIYYFFPDISPGRACCLAGCLAGPGAIRSEICLWILGVRLTGNYYGDFEPGFEFYGGIGF